MCMYARSYTDTFLHIHTYVSTLYKHYVYIHIICTHIIFVYTHYICIRTLYACIYSYVKPNVCVYIKTEVCGCLSSESSVQDEALNNSLQV